LEIFGVKSSKEKVRGSYIFMADDIIFGLPTIRIPIKEDG